MRTLHRLEEFKRESGDALFTKQQAIAVTLQLLELERNDPQNSEEERRVLSDAIKNSAFTYLDSTQTEIDTLLDTAGVARISATSVAAAVSQIIFDVE